MSLVHRHPFFFGSAIFSFSSFTPRGHMATAAGRDALLKGLLTASTEKGRDLQWLQVSYAQSTSNRCVDRASSSGYWDVEARSLPIKPEFIPIYPSVKNGHILRSFNRRSSLSYLFREENPLAHQQTDLDIYKCFYQSSYCMNTNDLVIIHTTSTGSSRTIGSCQESDHLSWCEELG